ncbi:MAG: penicillin-binding protein 1C, partial [Gammaproteobacteria bacterium]|nr:penicillin-binding protein 1C [Gammaproteobacteria bacterium]
MAGLRRVLGIVGVVAMLLALLDYRYPLQLPDNDASFARVVIDRHGELLRTFADKRGIWRYPVTLEQVSPHYLSALINYEDRWFYYHPGVNPLSILRAAWQNWRAGRIVSGGSTLTMQVARLFHPHSRSLAGKFQQTLRALQLELHLSKSEILELYLNYAPFGGTREGVQAASYQYLGKPAIDLTRAEATLMAVLPQAPSRLRP